MNPTRLAVYRPRVIVLLLAMLALGGVVSLRQLSQDFLPQVNLPVVTVGVPYPGAGPTEVEEQVTRVLEDQISGLSDVQEMSSVSRPGGASITITFREGIDVDRAVNDVRQRVDAARRDLPSAIQEPAVGKLAITDLPVLTLALSSATASPTALYATADETVRRQLETVEGVGAVRVLGGREPEIQVTVDPVALRARGLGLSDVSQALASQFTTTAAGQATLGQGLATRDVALRVEGRSTDIDALRSIPVRLPGGGSVLLGDVADVERTGADAESIVRFNGRDAVGLLVFKQPTANLTAVADRLYPRLDAVRQGLGNAYQLDVANDSSVQVRSSVKDVGVEFALAALITSFVLLLFLHKGRTTLIVLLAIPTSLVVTLIAMRLFGISLNIMSLLGLTTCIGILVDDSIVVLENIARWLERGVEPRQAAVQGRAEIGLAAVAITLVDVVVYGPVALISGATGAFLQSFALVIVVASLASLLVSFTLTPLLASRWLSYGGRASLIERLASAWEPVYAWAERRYRAALELPIRWPWLVVGAGVLILVASLALVPLVGTEFVPDQNSSTVIVAGELPGGASLEAANVAARQWEAALLDASRFPELRSVLTIVGTGQSDADRGGRFLQLTLDIGPAESRHRSNRELTRLAVDAARHIPTLATAGRAAEGGTSAVQVRFFAPTLPELTTAAEQARAKLAARPELTGVTLSGGTPSREVVARLDPARLRDAGLTADQVGTAARIAYQGVVAARLPRPDGGQVDVRLRLPGDVRRDPEALARLPLVGAGGQTVALGQVASLEAADVPAQINRINRQRVITLNAQPGGVPLGAATDAVRAELNALRLPADVRWEFAGGSQAQGEAFVQLSLAIAAGALLSYAVLVLLFESFVQPFVVLLCLPFAFIGAVLGLLAFGYTLNLLSLIGLLALFGLVGKNSILVVDATNALRARGMSRADALRDAGPARLRPILMTSLTLMLGLLPVALGLGEGGAIRAPLTAVIIGGMTTSTVLTLLFVPAIYSLLDDLRVPRRLRSRLRRRPRLDSLRPQPVAAE